MKIMHSIILGLFNTWDPYLNAYLIIIKNAFFAKFIDLSLLMQGRRRKFIAHNAS